MATKKATAGTSKKGVPQVEKSEPKPTIDKATIDRMQKDFNAKFNQTDIKDLRDVHKIKCPDEDHNKQKKELAMDILSTTYSKKAMTAFREVVSVAPEQSVPKAPEKGTIIVKKGGAVNIKESIAASLKAAEPEMKAIEKDAIKKVGKAVKDIKKKVDKIDPMVSPHKKGEKQNCHNCGNSFKVLKDGDELCEKCVKAKAQKKPTKPNVAPKAPKMARMQPPEEDEAPAVKKGVKVNNEQPAGMGAAKGKDHTYVTVNKDGTTTPISDEEGIKQLEALRAKNTVVVICPCYECPKNTGKKKCPKNCDAEDCILPPCENQNYCDTRHKELGLIKEKPAKKSNGVAPEKAVPAGKKPLPEKKPKQKSKEELEEEAAAAKGIDAHIAYLKAHLNQKNNEKLAKLKAQQAKDAKEAAKAKAPAKTAPAKKASVAPEKPKTKTGKKVTKK